MKCRLLVPKEVVKGQKLDALNRLVLDTEIAQPGTIIDHYDAWRLCGIHPVIILPLGGIASDFRELDGYEAEPADAECLAVAIQMGYVPKDYVLKPVATPASA